MIEAVLMRGSLSPAVPPGLAEWSLPIEQLGDLKNYSHNLTFDYGGRLAVTWLDR
jgi:hypothetical protein